MENKIKGMPDHGETESFETFEPSKMNNCKPGKLCMPVPEFDIIEKCELCGKLI